MFRVFILTITWFILGTTAVMAEPRTLTPAEKTATEALIRFLRGMEDQDFNKAVVLERLLNNGLIQVDNEINDATAGVGGPIIAPSWLSFNFTATTSVLDLNPESYSLVEIQNMVELAQTLFHEEVHTNQSTIERVLSNIRSWASGWNLQNAIEAEAWESTIEALKRWAQKTENLYANDYRESGLTEFNELVARYRREICEGIDSEGFPVDEIGVHNRLNELTVTNEDLTENVVPALQRRVDVFGMMVKLLVAYIGSYAETDNNGTLNGDPREYYKPFTNKAQATHKKYERLTIQWDRRLPDVTRLISRLQEREEIKKLVKKNEEMLKTNRAEQQELEKRRIERIFQVLKEYNELQFDPANPGEFQRRRNELRGEYVRLKKEGIDPEQSRQLKEQQAELELKQKEFEKQLDNLEQIDEGTCKM